MPGIVGLITQLPRTQSEAQLLRMLQAIHHDSSCAIGMWVDESLGVYLGWAAPKKSGLQQTPICNEREDVALVVSGEEFPERGTALRLKQRGHDLSLEGPSYLVHLYEEDPSFPSGLNGRFHGLLADKTRGTALLFNDRYGMHRLYYHESRDAFYFAAEAKAILEVRSELREADPQGLGEFVACGCVLENRTLFTGIRMLPPASAWVFRNGSLQRKSNYFEPREWEDQAPLEQESYYRELREVFSKNLPRYFDGPQRIGMSLTGGLDTRVIMAWHKATSESLPCYSFGGMFRDCQDVLIARQVASACGQSHEVIPVGQGFLSHFPQYAERTIFLTEGCTDVSHAPDLYANERAAEIAPIRMTGNYGGEVLRRVRAFKPVVPTSGLFRPEFLSYVNAAGQTYAGMLQGHPLSFAVFRQAPWHHYGLLALEQTQLFLRSPYLDNDFVRTVFRAPESALTNNDISLRLIADGNPALRRIRTDRGLGGNRGSLYSAISRKLLEFTFKAEYAYDYGMPQSVARIDHFLSPLHLERLFLGRHKFYHFRFWYRTFLADYVREMLLDERTLSRPYLEKKRLESMVRDHLQGDRNYTTGIHKVLTLELLHRLFLDSKPSLTRQPVSSEILARTR
jgi:asparagine synthase (glutamine-hydrolysing)